MQKYKVIPLGMSGLGNKVYRNGDVVTASCFDTPVEDLVKGGWLAPVTDADTTSEDEAGEQTELDAHAHVVTGEDLANNPELAEEGIEVGEVIELGEEVDSKEEAPAAKDPLTEKLQKNVKK